MTDNRPSNCRNRLRDEGKAYPKSGCYACPDRLANGCPHEKTPEPDYASLPPFRAGPPPDTGTTKDTFLVLVERRGWRLTRWGADGMLIDTDTSIPYLWRIVHPSMVCFWAWADGR